jgi:translation elongation factor EF-1alpha
MDEQLIGTVTHYFPRIEVAAVKVTVDELRIGDTIRVLGHTSNFTQRVHSMEMDYAPVEAASVGDLVAIQVAERARVNDQVYRIRAHVPADTEVAANAT